VVAVVAIALIVALALQPDDDPDDATPPADAGEQVGDVPENDPDNGDAENVPEVEPGRLDALDTLIDTVAADRQSAGEKADDLIDDLRDLRDDYNDDDARDLITDIGEWIIDGELDAEVGEDAIATLEAVSRPDNEGLSATSQTFANLAFSWAERGGKAKDLRDELGKLLSLDGDKLAEEATKLDAKVAEWMDKDEINDDVGSWTRAILEPLISPRTSD
jgi:hypothetical protein